MINILREPDKIEIVTKNSSAFIEELSDVHVNFTISGKEMNVNVLANKTAISYVKCRWNGSFDKSVKICGDAFERGYGDLEFRGIVPERVMAWYFIAHTADSNSGYGVKVRPNAFCFWQADKAGVTLWLDIRCGSQPLALEGKTLDVVTIVFDESKEQVFDFMKSFCKSMSDQPLSVSEPVYGSNNWYYAYGNSSAEQIIEDTKLIAELTCDLEVRPYMVIDDGWQFNSENGECNSTIGTVSNHKFNDMKALANLIKDHDVKPGLWVRPLKCNPNSINKDILSNRDSNFLDPSLDESMEVIAADIQRITKEWGYQLIKYDFSTYDVLGCFVQKVDVQMTQGDWEFKNKLTTAQAIKKLYKTVYENANGATIIGCNCVSHLGSGYFHLHRSGDDTSGFSWERTRLMGVNSLAFRLPQHKAFFEVDADCVGITGAIDWKLNSIWLDLLANSGTPLFVSMNPQKMTPEIKKDLKAAFVKAAKQTSICTPLDLTDTTCPSIWEIDGEVKEYNFIDTMGVIKL